MVRVEVEKKSDTKVPFFVVSSKNITNDEEPKNLTVTNKTLSTDKTSEDKSNSTSNGTSKSISKVKKNESATSKNVDSPSFPDE